MVLKLPIDLIIIDLNMPVAAGPDFVRKLRSTPEISSLPVLAITAHVMNEDRNQLIDTGFSEILFKPFREKEIIEKISLFLQ